MKKYIIMTGLALAMSSTAWADNVAHCEVLLVQNIEDPELGGTMQITAYHPAVSFIASVYDEDPEHKTQIEGHTIRALLCQRNDLIPAETDYPMMATGIPFVVSQDFDRTDTDSLTVFWKDGAFDYVYKGHPLSDEAQSDLEARLADFTARGLYEKVDTKTADDEAIDGETESESETGPETETETETQIETEAKSDIEDLKEETIEEALEDQVSYLEEEKIAEEKSDE